MNKKQKSWKLYLLLFIIMFAFPMFACDGGGNDDPYVPSQAQVDAEIEAFNKAVIDDYNSAAKDSGVLCVAGAIDNVLVGDHMTGQDYTQGCR